MISHIEYIQLKAFARQDGLMFGLLWIITFGCFIGSFDSPDLQIGFIAGMVATPILVYSRLKSFRDKVLNGCISYKRAVAFVTFTLAYASVIMAAATFIYFYFFDNGVFMVTLQESMETPEMKLSFKNMGMDIAMLNEQMRLLRETRPIDLAFNILWNGLTTSFMLAVVIGLFGKKTSKIKA